MENLGKHLLGGLAFTENDVASHITDIFRPVSQEVSMKDSCIIQIRPVSMNQAGPYDFQIHSRGNYYVQMNQIRLYMRAKIVAETGAAIVAADGVSVCNLMGNSMFQSIEIEIGGKLITDLQNTHVGYKSYLETLLSYTPNAGTGPLAASLWNLDEAKHFEDVKYNATKDHADNSKNDGFIGRRATVGEGETFDMMIPLHSDFLSSDRLLPPGISMVLKLTRAKDSFVLMHPTSTKTFRIELSSLKLSVPYIALADSIVANHKTLGTTKSALLPIKKTDIIVHHVGAGALLAQLSNLFPNRLPKTLIIGMLATTAYNGTTSSNPYNFQNFGVNHVSISKNGVMIPSEPYQPDWDAKLYAREYRCFFDNIGIGTDNIGSNINPTLYKNGATLFAWDLTPDKCNGYHWHKREEGGTIDIDFRFKTALEAGVTFMLFGVYDALVAIDREDNVAVSY